MCFEKTILISREFGRINHQPANVSSTEGIKLWRASHPAGEILFSEIREENYSIWYCEYQMSKPSIITMQNPGSSSIALSFTLKKNQHYEVSNLRNGVARRNHYNLTYLPEVNCDFIFRKGEYASFGIEFSEDYLQKLSSNDSEVFSGFIDNIIQHKAATITTNHHPATSEIMDIVNELVHFRTPGKMRTLYIKAKVIDLLRLSIENMLADANPGTNKITLADEKKLYDVRDFILNNLDNADTLPEIAYRHTINEYKLKTGFKKLFGKGVIAFVHEERLKRAKTQIDETTFTMKEIASHAGYKNISNFTTAFRKRFGYPPGTLKRSNASND